MGLTRRDTNSKFYFLRQSKHAFGVWIAILIILYGWYIDCHWFVKFGDVFGMHNTTCGLDFQKQSNVLRHLKSACGISLACVQQLTVSTLKQFYPLGVGQQRCWGSGGAGAGRPASWGEVVSRQILCSLGSQLLHLWGWTRDLSSLLLISLLLLLFEWLRFRGIDIFLGWLKISLELKDGKKV